MKKYQRLLLTIVSVISISLFLIYRHHYNRLHHVLEVFNFFGTPCNFSELQQSEGVLLEHDWGPYPLWQEIDGKGYIYSAFLVEKNKVQGIGVKHTNQIGPKTCMLFFENESKPLKGKFSILKVGEEKAMELVAYTFTCTFSKSEKIPYSVTFKTQNGAKYISSLITNTLDKKISLNATVCVTPGNFTKKSLLEFLSFQNLVGIDSFIVYHEQNIPYRLVKLLRNLYHTLNISVAFLPYNLPLFVPSSFTKNLLEYECQLRTRSHSKYSLVLGINEYIVPSYDIKSANLRLPIKKFCLNHVNQNRPMILQNFEVVDDYNFSEIKMVNNNSFQVNDVKRIPNVFETNCVIHRYEKCDKGLKTKSDLSVKRFSTDFTRTTLVQFLLQ